MRHTVDNGGLNNWSKYFFFRSTGPAIITHLLQQFPFRKTYHLQKHLSVVLCSNAAARRHYKDHRNKRKNEEDETDTVTAFTLLSHGENIPKSFYFNGRTKIPLDSKARTTLHSTVNCAKGKDNSTIPVKMPIFEGLFYRCKCCQDYPLARLCSHTLPHSFSC